jgi:hypothetical protein
MERGPRILLNLKVIAFKKNPKATKFSDYLNLGKKLVKCYLSSIALYGAETWTLRKVDHKYLEVWNVVLAKDEEDQLDRSCEK